MHVRASDEITLIASTLAHLRAELEAPGELANLLDAAVSSEWPTGEYDRDAMEFFRTCLEQGGEAVEGWYGWYAVREAVAGTPRVLVGAAGYFGPPDADGAVELGYSVLPEWQGRGYARDMVQALVQNAFQANDVKRVVAHTTSENLASIAVLLRCGFIAAGTGREGSVRFERIRPAPDTSSATVPPCEAT